MNPAPQEGAPPRRRTAAQPRFRPGCIDRLAGPEAFQITFNHAKATMQTSKANQSPERRTNSTPAAKPAQSSLPASSSQPSSALTSRPELPSLFPNAVGPGDASQQGHAAQTSSPRFKPVVAATSDVNKTKGEDVTAKSAMAAGTKRARDGKDGPEAKPSSTEPRDHRKSSGKPRSKGSELADHNQAESASQHPTKRARKDGRSIKSDKGHRPKPANDGATHTEAHSPRPKIIPILTLSNQVATSDSEPGSPTSWKNGAQSPRASAANRASITLAPRRNSNASAIERTSPARQVENPPTDKPAALDTASSTPVMPNDDFAFSACDLDKEGVMCVVADSAEQGKQGQAAPVPASPEEGVLTHRQASTPPAQQALPGQFALAPDMTALMDELDAALAKPIEM
ncbi:hypothetical protein [Noviherbaspirillum soli]|uniref:hypothetical protein n=1 Tax=Noviherbaspirillum soli TaxID=1064518 RepID=UPI00188C866B|nr:hypothetical protein [Noviherbaspirillum soli]